MAPEAPTPKREQIQTSVLAATEELLGEGVPFADLNIERIATRAGISRTAFYFYFKDKRELLIRLTQGVTDSLYAEADGWFSGSADADAEAELRAALGAVAGIYADHETLLRAIVEVSTYDVEIATFWRGVVQRFADAAAARLRATTEGDGLDPDEVGFALVWMVERCLYETVVQDRDAGRLNDAIVAIWMRTVYGRL